MTYHESWVERQIREAVERGEFDDLPGAGKPLRHLDTNDPDWWAKQLMEREGLDTADALPPVLALRREASTYPEALVDLGTEDGVREVVRDYNARVVADRLRPVAGRAMPAVAPRLDVEEMVARWRELRAERAAELAAAATEVAPHAAEPRRPWWARWRARARGRRR